MLKQSYLLGKGRKRGRSMGILFTVIFYLSLMFSVILLIYTVIVCSWKSFLALGIATIPISLYFFSGEPPIQFVGLLSIFCFAIALLVFLLEKRNSVFNFTCSTNGCFSSIRKLKHCRKKLSLLTDFFNFNLQKAPQMRCFLLCVIA